LSRRQESGWLTDDWDNIDPDVVHHSLKILSFHSESSVDAIWHMLIQWDPEDLLEARARQKMALARYARQDLHKWDDVEVREIRGWYNRLVELMNQESVEMSSREG
jgi:hypothetical protein